MAKGVEESKVLHDGNDNRRRRAQDAYNSIKSGIADRPSFGLFAGFGKVDRWLYIDQQFEGPVDS